MGEMEVVRALSYEELAVKLLNAKYNDSFVIDVVQSHSFLRGYYTVIAYQENNGDVLFKADVNSDGTGISDNYITKLVCNHLADKVAQNLDALKGIYYIFTEVMMEPSMLDNIEITLEEFMEVTPKNKFTININYCPEDTNVEEVYSALTNVLNGLGCISGKIHFYIMDEPMLSKVQDYVETHDKCYDDYKKLVEEYLVEYIDFEKGTIKNTRDEIQKILENKL